MNNIKSEYLVGLIFGLSVPFIWGAWIVISRFGVITSLNAYDITALRLGVASLIVLPIILTRGLSGLSLKRATIFSIGVGAPFALTSFLGMRLAPIAHAGVLTNGSIPIFTAIFALLFLSERLSKKRFLAMFIIIFGGLCIGGDSILSSASYSLFLGDLLLIAAGALFSLYLTALDKWKPEVIQTIVAVPVISGVIYLPIWLLFLPSKIMDFNNFPPWSDIALQGGFQGVISSFIVIMLLTRATRSIGATTVATLLAGGPAIAVVLGVFILNENPSILSWAGVSIATIGMILAVKKEPQKTL